MLGVVIASRYDAIVVGARCAGSPTAMLLARTGLRVLLIDRARFPSDTISGPVIKPAGVARLERWGLLERLVSLGAPPMQERPVYFGAERLPPSPGSDHGLPAFAPRRIDLDAMLVREARAAGAEVMEGTTLVALRFDADRVCGIEARDGARRAISAQAPILIGADGRNSAVARLANAAGYHNLGCASVGYYAWSEGVPDEDLGLRFRDWRLLGACPTSDGLTLRFVQAPVAERNEFRRTLEQSYMSAWQGAFSDGAVRVSRILGMAQIENSSGPGWALVGDAGHQKDPLAARGIADAWRDAECLAEAVTAGLSGESPLDEALSAYGAARDHGSMEVAERNHDLALMEGNLADQRQRFIALARAEHEGDERHAAMAASRSAALLG